MKQKNVHWFPGHMVKALREIEERLKVIDIIIEVVDSRAPIASKNPFLEKITNSKKRLIVFTKKDLCDENRLQPFQKYYLNQGYEVLSADLNNNNDIKNIVNKALFLGKDRQEKYLKRGMKPQPLRVMIIGIPNVGKSTLINRLAKKKAASTANTPGHTRAQQWIRINENFELLDTPGILPPHYEDKNIALNLALLGSIKNEILPQNELYEYLMEFLIDNYYNELINRYGLETESKDLHVLTKMIAEKRKLFVKGGVEDIDSVEKLVLKEFRDGVIAKVVVDKLC